MRVDHYHEPYNAYAELQEDIWVLVICWKGMVLKSQGGFRTELEAMESYESLKNYIKTWASSVKEW